VEIAISACSGFLLPNPFELPPSLPPSEMIFAKQSSEYYISNNADSRMLRLPFTNMFSFTKKKSLCFLNKRFVKIASGNQKCCGDKFTGYGDKSVYFFPFFLFFLLW